MDDQAIRNLLEQAGRGETAAVLAAVAGDQALLHKTDQRGYRLLHWACLGGDHLELVQGLVEAGSDLHAKTNGGRDALYWASAYNRLAVAAYLLDRGADPCTRGDRFTALGHAAYFGYQEMCVLLLSRGADLLAVMTGYGAEANRTALDLYGIVPHNLTPLQREQGRQALREAFAEGPHITQVRRRNMDRRIALLVFAAQHDFQPLAARRAELLELHPALPTNVPIPGLPNGTAAERLALLHMRVLGDKDLFRHIVSFEE